MSMHPRIYSAVSATGWSVPRIARETMEVVENDVIKQLYLIDGDLNEIARCVQSGRTSDALKLIVQVQSRVDKSRSNFTVIKDTFPPVSLNKA